MGKRVTITPKLVRQHTSNQ